MYKLLRFCCGHKKTRKIFKFIQYSDTLNKEAELYYENSSQV